MRRSRRSRSCSSRPPTPSSARRHGPGAARQPEDRLGGRAGRRHRTHRRYLETAEEGLAHVAGYATAHDVSEREFQIERGGTWDKGKNCETFNPLGPWLVTADEVPDPQALPLRLWVNGELRQNGTTAEQIFPVGEVVRYLSHFMTLYPGDVINTGTPAGVAMGQPEPKPYLRAGDVVELEVEGLGRQRQELKGRSRLRPTHDGGGASRVCTCRPARPASVRCRPAPLSYGDGGPRRSRTVSSCPAPVR